MKKPAYALYVLAALVFWASPAQPLRIKDATGNSVSFPRLPQRMVVVGQGTFMPMHLLYLFPECKDRLVGYEERYKTANTFLPLVDPRFSGKTALATNPGPEHVAALNPDLVIMKGTVPSPLSASLSRLRIPVVYLGMENPEQFLEDVRTVGALFGNPSRAHEIIDFYQTRLDTLVKKISGLASVEKPRVLIMGYHERGGKAAVQVPGRSWTQTIQALRAGGNPVWLEAVQAGEGWTVINFEQVALWDPEKIFVIPSFRLDRREVLAHFTTDPRWRLLRAAENREVYLFPTDIFGWDSSEPRWILGMMWLATKMFPEKFRDIDMKEEVHRFFGSMYRLERGVIEETLMPLISLEGR